MKEYEYIVGALEGYLCDELTGVICSENYRNRSYELGYRKVFLEYCNLHQNFEKNKERFGNPALEQCVREEFQSECQQKRKDIQDRFLKDLRACSDVDIDSFTDKYLQKLKDEEVETVAKRICLYPYLTEVLRKNRGRGEFHGKKF